jgi:hypothetical protein
MDPEECGDEPCGPRAEQQMSRHDSTMTVHEWYAYWNGRKLLDQTRYSSQMKPSEVPGDFTLQDRVRAYLILDRLLPPTGWGRAESPVY